MRCLLLFITILSVLVQLSVAPPVNQKSKDEKHENENEVDEMEELKNMEYRRYLQEVVQVLESDPHFREKLVNADAEDIHTGRIAEELQFVNHNIRSRLDELKREEMERLKHLATKENEIRTNLDIGSLKIPEHLDHTNTRSFEIYDLKKLIKKTAKDLTQIDKMRRAQFKEHEMEKEYEEQEKLKRNIRKMNEAERKKYEQELEELKEKQRKHEPVHHPGSKQQLEAVWEEQDHMESDQFNPKVFFLLHDIDGNGQWDQDEVKTLFLKELDKLYAQGASQEDLLKRAEEMERMREHVFNEADVNKDGLIHIDEFLLHTMQPDFRRDQGWQGIDEQQIYSPEEFEAFKQHRQEEMQKMMAKGMLPPHPDSVPAQHESFPLEYGHGAVPQGVAPPQANSNPNVAHQQQLPDQVHPQYHQQPSIVVAQQHQQPQGQVYQYQQQQYNPGLSQQQQNSGLSQQQQYNPGLSQQQHHNIGLSQQQQHNPGLSQQHQQPLQGQLPVQQLHPGAVPVQHHQDQVLVQQQGQIPVGHNQAHSPDLTQQQAHANPAAVAENIASNAVPQQNLSQGNSHAAAGQPEANLNRIPAAGKA